MESKTGKSLKINCGNACLLSDREDVLDKYGKIKINCGGLIVSSQINAKLAAGNVKINCGDVKNIGEITGEILQLDSNTVIDGRTDFKDYFIITLGNLILKDDGIKRLSESHGGIVLGALYYPESGDLADLARINGAKRAYPDGAQVLLGDYDLGKALASAQSGGRHIWVSGRLSALDRKVLEDARTGGFKITCASLFTYEEFSASFGDLFNCTDRHLVPDGYEITGDLESVKLPLYGSKIYVNGNFTMAAKDLPFLEKVESIIVNGKAVLFTNMVETFRKKGKANDYEIIDGTIRHINGFQQYGRGQLADFERTGEKVNFVVNGCLFFDDDVTAEDVAWIDGISYNGVVIAPAAVRAALNTKVREANGIMCDLAQIEKLTGRTIQDWIAKITGGLDISGNGDQEEDQSVKINTGVYLLI
jgi:hypothetical protein